MIAYECSAGLVVGANFSPGMTIGANGTFGTISLTRDVAACGRSLLRGVFHGHQSGVYFEASGRTVILRAEQTTDLADGDTFFAVIPLVYK